MIDNKYERYQEYMREHKVVELLEDICSAVAYLQPENVNEFIIEQLEMRQKSNTTTLPLFTEKEIENIYYLYNLKAEPAIPKEKAKEALKCIANSKFNIEEYEKEKKIPDLVTLDRFKNLVEDAFKITVRSV